MKLVTIERPGGGAPGVLLSGGAILDLKAAAGLAGRELGTPEPVPDTVAALFAGEVLDTARRLAGWAEENTHGLRERLEESGGLLPGNTPLLAPIPRPSLIVSHGLAYRAHLEEMGVPAPREPAGFLKAPSSVTGPGAPILLPPDYPDMVDFEGEFSIVIGRPCHRVSPGEVLDCVGGYTIINDVSARDWVARALDPGQTQMEAALSWTANIQGKQFPSFTPMGPVVVTADEIGDPNDLHISTTVNGETMQDADTNDLIFPVETIVSYFSQWFGFQPGDVITTGSPPGVGYGRSPQVFLKAGDVVEITVSRVGTLLNPVKMGQ